MAADTRPPITDNDELLQHLSDTIGEEVMQRMDGVDWKYTENAPPLPVKDDPNKVESTPETKPDNPVATKETTPNDSPDPSKKVETTSIDWESLRDPKTGLIAGKWPTEAEALKGTHSLIHMAKSAFAKADELERQNQELTKKLSAAPTPSTETTKAPGTSLALAPELAEVLSSMKEEGLSDPEFAERLALAIEKRAAAVAEQAVESRNKAAEKQQSEWNEVDSYMAQTYPSSLRFVDELGLFIESDPITKATVSALLRSENRKAAMEQAWINYAHSLGMDPKVSPTVLDPALQEKERQLRAQGEVRKEEVEAARKDAGLLPSGAGGVHESPQAVGPSQEEIDEAGRLMKVTGSGEKWRALTIGNRPELSGPWFDN